MKMGNRIKPTITTLLGALLLTSLSTFAQDAPLNLSLEEAIQYGMENSVVIRENRRYINEAEQRRREVLAQGYPQINASLNYTNYPSLPVSLIPAVLAGGAPDDDPIEVQFGTPQNASARAELSQLVFDGAYFLGVSAARKLVNLERERTILSEIDMKHNITQSYYTALISDLQITSIERRMENLVDIKDETKSLYDEGFVEEIEVDRLMRSVNDLELNLKAAERDHDLAITALKFHMGMDFKQSIELTDRLDSLMLGNSFALETFNVSNRQEYKITQLRKETNEINIRYARSAFLPKMYLFGSYEQQAQRESFDFFDGDQPWFEIAVVGVNVEVPIFDGFYKRSRVEQAKLQLEGVYLEEEQLVNGLTFEAEQNKINYLRALETVESTLASRNLAEKIYKVTSIKYQEGVGSSLELTTAQDDFQAAEDNYIAAMYRFLIAQSDLKKSYGLY
jgi:outer membrane protein TolC